MFVISAQPSKYASFVSRNPSLGPLYTLFRKYRPKEGGCLLIAIDESVQYEKVHLNVDGTLEAMCISVVASKSKLPSNFRIPPRSSCPPSYTAFLTLLATLLYSGMQTPTLPSGIQIKKKINVVKCSQMK